MRLVPQVLMCVLFFALLLGVGAACSQEPPAAEEIPLERCDLLPVVRVRIDDADMRFLVDTAATSLLNLKSFTKGRSKKIQISSWSGIAATSAREVSVPELALGSHRLHDLKLPAIDLSPIGKACGGRIDGILGVDLLEKMGATIDFRRRIALLGVRSANGGEAARLADVKAAMSTCINAFNLGRAEELEACLDPEIVFYTEGGEFRGRSQMLGYLRRRFFSLLPHARFQLNPHDLRLLGDAVWCDYDYSVESPTIHIAGRGMMVARKTEGHWRLLNMHNSVAQPEKPSQP